MWWYDFQDDGSVADYIEDNFGLVHVDLTPKPGFYAISTVTLWMAGSAFSSRIVTADPSVDGVEFRLPSGQQAMAIWKHGTNSGVLIKGASAMQVINDGTSNPQAVQLPNSLFQLTESPIWVTGETLEVQ